MQDTIIEQLEDIIRLKEKYIQAQDGIIQLLVEDDYLQPFEEFMEDQNNV